MATVSMISSTPVGYTLMRVISSCRYISRWGKLIWETRTPGQGWDGRDQNTGEFVPEDAYVFRVRGKDFKGKYHEYVGTVTVLK